MGPEHPRCPDCSMGYLVHVILAPGSQGIWNFFLMKHPTNIRNATVQYLGLFMSVWEVMNESMQVEQESIEVLWDFLEKSAVFSAFTRVWEDCSAIMRVQIDHNSEGFWHNIRKKVPKPRLI